jgi:hypothetical protein
MSNNEKWTQFLFMADNFFIILVISCHYRFLYLPFLFGQAMELYLKAVYAKQTNDPNRAINFSHNVRKLFQKCQENDPAFMPNFKFEGTVKEMKELEQKYLSGELKDDKEGLRRINHFFSNQIFYVASEHLQDLKYFGSKWKTSHHKHEISVMCGSITSNNELNMVRDIKRYLHPEISNGTHRDDIKLFLEENKDHPLDCRKHLSYLYE